MSRFVPRAGAYNKSLQTGNARRVTGAFRSQLSPLRASQALPRRAFRPRRAGLRASDRPSSSAARAQRGSGPPSTPGSTPVPSSRSIFRSSSASRMRAGAAHGAAAALQRPADLLQGHQRFQRADRGDAASGRHAARARDLRRRDREAWRGRLGRRGPRPCRARWDRTVPVTFIRQAPRSTVRPLSGRLACGMVNAGQILPGPCGRLRCARP